MSHYNQELNLEQYGITGSVEILHNPGYEQLFKEELDDSLEGFERGVLSEFGAVKVDTGRFTGRSPKDKYIVEQKLQQDLWWGDVNAKISKRKFENLKNRIAAYMCNRKLYVVDCIIGADINYQRSVRVATEFAWQALVAQNLFIYDGTPLTAEPDITILAVPGFKTYPEIDGVRSNAAILLDLHENVVLIAGSAYAGEIKKSAFTIMNAHLPDAGALPMHCSANMGESGDVALYFGLSGIFNFEGGCYAKTIRLDQEHEPVIWDAANQFGTVLENVSILSKERKADFEDSCYTENTRAAYPLASVENIVPGGIAGHPENLFFLTADAFGVIPPIAKLDHDEAIYYFLSGYTSKIAGTERGLSKKPIATFSTCFGEPFLPLKPHIYANLLKEKISMHQSQVWLINTGWTAGDYHTGHRMPLPYTRRMVNWILNHEYLNVEFHPDPVFGIQVPDAIEGIPTELLIPERTWKDKKAFNQIARQLKEDFKDNFEKFSVFE